MSEQQLIVIERKDALATFSAPDGLDPILARVRNEVDKFLGKGLGASTKKGRDEIRSFAADVVRSKTYLDNVGKALVDELKDVPKKVDASRRKVRETLDQWRDEVRAPLTEWEAAEDARIDRHKAAIERLTGISTAPLAGFSPNAGLSELRAKIATVEAIEVGPVCEEFEADYGRAKGAALRALNNAIAQREVYEQEQAELARLRAAEAEREAQHQKEAEAAAAIERERQRKEREATIAAEAAERARLKAESDARKERERLENEARAAERAAQREDYHRRMLQHVKNCGFGFIDEQPQPAVLLQYELTAKIKFDEENFGDLLPEALAAKDEALARIQRAIDEAVRREVAERAARQEREIAARREQALRDEAAAAERRAAEAEAKARRELEEAAAAEAAETARREKNKRHAAAVNCKAMEAFVSGGIPEDSAKLAVTMIAKRQVPAVSISY